MAMIFEIGKYYQHTGGRALAVRGCISTTLYGPHTLIAEEWPSDRESFMAVGKDEAATVNYHEILEAEWLKLWEPENLTPSVSSEPLPKNNGRYDE